MPLPAPRAIAERILSLLALPALAFGIYYSARLSQADAFYRQDTPESLADAVRMESGNASYHQLYAEHLESAGLDPARERETAALLSPHESAYWTDLAVQAETHSDFPAAERLYLKAASVNHMFAPRWALMNFYFRRHNSTAFWQWTREAMPLAYGDSSQFFRLCWLMTNNAEFIHSQLPWTEYTRSQYLAFLTNNGHFDAAPPIARELADRASPEYLNQLLDYCGQAMTKDMASSVEVWNLLCRRKLEPFNRLAPGEGVIITNGDFQTPPIERGFDWHLSGVDGVSVTMNASGITVELTGDQAQAVTTMNEWIPVENDKTYRIEYIYSGSSADSSQPSGLAWQIDNPVTGVVITRSADLKTAPGDTSGQMDFTARGMSAAMLSLVYERAPGTVRHEEKFTIRKISARLQP